jgi:hypothetical protein
MSASSSRSPRAHRVGLGVFVMLLLALALFAPAGAQVGSGFCFEGLGDNQLEGTAGNDVLTGIGGQDEIEGRGGGDTINGGDGDDRLCGNEGNDNIDGGGGDDFIHGGPGRDFMEGGPGIDEVSYEDYGSPVNADPDPDDAGDDGTSGEGDVLNDDVENIVGGSAGDILTGDAGPNTLAGRFGDDTLDGLAGNDIITGGFGVDTVRGGDGADTLLGDEGFALAGVTPGSDTLFGGNGPDTLKVRDGVRDVAANCGPVFRPILPRQPNPDPGDVADLDLVDAGQTTPPTTRISTPGCETVMVGAINEGPNLVVSARAVRLSKRGVARIRVSCPRPLPSPCSGRLSLRTVTRRTAALGSRRYRLASGKKGFVRVPLTRRKRRLVTRPRRVYVQAEAVEEGEFGPKTTTVILSLRARRRSSSTALRAAAERPEGPATSTGTASPTSPWASPSRTSGRSPTPAP